MGIDGLLKLLKPVTQKQHISTFKQKKIAVDIMPWIYKGCYYHTMQHNQNIQSMDFLCYILQMLDILIYYEIRPIFVFDGRLLQAKNSTTQKRRKDKQQNKQKGLQFLKNGQMEQARKYLSRCIIIDERIINLTICALVTLDIPFLVSPYQADSQIAKLKRLKMIDAAITEDSDLITFGVNVILKLNKNGYCDYVDLTQWSPKDVTDMYLKYFLAFDEINKIQAAVLAGSDYNKSVKGIGICRAIKLIAFQANIANSVNALKLNKTYTNLIPQNYLQTVQRSKLIFIFSTVYNPIQKKLQCLSPQLLQTHKPEKMTIEELYKMVGIHYEYSQQVSRGRINSRTLQKRHIRVLTFPIMFPLDIQNLMVHQALFRHSKIQIQIQKKLQLQQQLLINKMNDEAIYQQLNKFRARTNNELEQTQQTKQKRKQQRNNRMSKLQDMMNTFVEVFGQSDEEKQNNDQNGGQDEEWGQINRQEKTDQINQGLEKIYNIKITSKKIINNKQKQSKYQHDDDESNESEDESVFDNLSKLNPFVRKDIKPLVMKLEHLQGSNKKK